MTTPAGVMQRRGSLRARLTGAVMVPLTALVMLFGGITLWVTHDTEANTVDRVLIGSVRTLSLAYNSPPDLRGRIIPLTIKLLRRRARPEVHYSVYLGDRLIAGDPALRPPADYSATATDRIDRHPPTIFTNAYRDTRLVRGYADPRDAAGVIQAAYLRTGLFHGRPARIAVEYRRTAGFDGVIALQIADYIDDRRAYERRTFLNVLLYAAGTLLVSIGLFWAAILWGLRPLLQLARQIETAQQDPSLAFRLAAPPAAARETMPFISAFNELMARLEQVTRSLREFTSNASHQMRTPLAIARVHLDVLERYGPASPEGKAALIDIPDAIGTLEKLLGQLIVLARSEERPPGLMRPFDLTVVAQEALATAMARAPADLDIGYDEAADGPFIALGEPLMAAELIGNLIDNAIRYNRPDGLVSVEVGRRDGRAVIAIIDDGPGIPEADRDRAWERFTRLQGQDGPAGTGLGLPIVRSLAARMDAIVTLAAGPDGKGVRAEVQFQAAAGALQGFEISR
ncbi:sensor histidine kinase [Sphingomonas sp. MMS24-J13]|uniref:sensor histidine kinase n=1 Tax=Sphingomonas sp. MMS24-J13 TaxID=3238686 RepID=UPI00385066FF